MTTRTSRNGLLFPDGPTRRSSRVPVVLAGVVLAVALALFLARGRSVPEPVVMLLPRPAAAATTPQSSTSDASPPESWEELVAARSAARANEPGPTTAPAVAATREEEPERRTARRQPSRRREAPAPRPAAAEPAATAAAPAAESAVPGRLNASSTPWGQLIVDGRMYGNTPRLNLPIAVGQRRVRIARDGFVPFDTTITVEPGEVVRVTGITLREQP